MLVVTDALEPQMDDFGTGLKYLTFPVQILALSFILLRIVGPPLSKKVHQEAVNCFHFLLLLLAFYFGY